MYLFVLLKLLITKSHCYSTFCQMHGAEGSLVEKAIHIPQWTDQQQTTTEQHQEQQDTNGRTYSLNLEMKHSAALFVFMAITTPPVTPSGTFSAIGIWVRNWEISATSKVLLLPRVQQVVNRVFLLYWRGIVMDWIRS